MTWRLPFDPEFSALPATLPLFPLTGVLLLPGGRLPLNIFEPRYLAMIDDALRTDRLIGMIQPSAPARDAPPVFSTGCAGRIVSFDETEDGRYLISLAGLCRFAVMQEVEALRGYRRAAVSWDRFRQDMEEASCPGFDRARFTDLLQGYFHKQGLSADWKVIENTPDERLLTCLAMICPFEPCEKQALLEAPDLTQRAAIMMQLLQMGVAEPPEGDRARH